MPYVVAMVTGFLEKYVHGKSNENNDSMMLHLFLW